MSHLPDSTSTKQGRGRIKRNLKPCHEPDEPVVESKFKEISPQDLPADTVLSRLRVLDRRVQGSGPWQAICPVHADLNPSLSVSETDKGVCLLHCFAGCDTDKILEAIELDYSDLFPSYFALQFGSRKPGEWKSYVGGDRHRSTRLEEPTDEECEQLEELLSEWKAPLPAVKELARTLGLPRSAIQSLNVGYKPDEACWIIPERDDEYRIVGLVRRFRNSQKKALSGSRRGLTIPAYSDKLPAGPIYLVEGASDTAALVSVGAVPVGRSNAFGNRSEQVWLTRLLSQHTEREIIVVGERDSGAGRLGAKELSLYLTRSLNREVTWAFPAKPFKDVREQIVAGAWDRGLMMQEGQQ